MNLPGLLVRAAFAKAILLAAIGVAVLLYICALAVHAGHTTQIMFDMKTRTTIELPDWVREVLAVFDGI